MNIIYSSFVINTLTILLTLFWIKYKSYKTDNEVIASANEAPVTVVLALFCLGLSYFLLISKGIDSTVAGTDQGSYWFIGGFSIVSAFLGCFSLLYTYLKKYIILQDRLIVVSVLGVAKSFFWDQIKSVRIPLLSRNIMLKAENGSCLIHSGNSKQYKNFVGVLKNHVPRNSGADTINDLYNRL